MLAEVARDQAPVEIVAAAGGVADDDRDSPARKERLDRLGGGVGRKQQDRDAQYAMQHRLSRHGNASACMDVTMQPGRKTFRGDGVPIISTNKLD